MHRPSVLLLLCAALLLPMTAVARLPGPLQAVPASKVRDLSDIRSSRVLRVLVNQSRNSSGEVQGQAIGVEYHRLRAFEQYLVVVLGFSYESTALVCFPAFGPR